jgi:hypothetical protein
MNSIKVSSAVGMSVGTLVGIGVGNAEEGRRVGVSVLSGSAVRGTCDGANDGTRVGLGESCGKVSGASTTFDSTFGTRVMTPSDELTVGAVDVGWFE